MFSALKFWRFGGILYLAVRNISDFTLLPILCDYVREKWTTSQVFVILREALNGVILHVEHFIPSTPPYSYESCSHGLIPPKAVPEDGNVNLRGKTRR